MPTNISVKVEDFDGNSTSIAELGEYTPLFEEKIDKSTWSLVGNFPSMEMLMRENCKLLG